MASDTTTGPPGGTERRVARLTPAPCANCGTADPVVATRTDYVLYLRCSKCFHVWSVPRPDVKPLGS